MSMLKLNTMLSNSLKNMRVCFKCFKELNRESENGIDALIASIKRVYQDTDCMYVEFENNKMIVLDFNGGYKKYRSDGKLASQRSLGTKMRLKDGHIQLKIEGRTIFMERLVAICKDIINDSMPLSYADLVANVMDGSGSVFTASKLGIPVNYAPDNIEWCSRQENGVHGSMIMEMYKRTGCVYRYSANDRILQYIFLNRSNARLINYCQKKFKKN